MKHFKSYDVRISYSYAKVILHCVRYSYQINLFLKSMLSCVDVSKCTAGLRSPMYQISQKNRNY